MPRAWRCLRQFLARLPACRHISQLSREYASKTDGNSSPYALAGIPMLFSALRCLLVELNTRFSDRTLRNRQILAVLADGANDIQVILDQYSVPLDLAHRLQLLLEIRHEIIYPAHAPGPE